MAHLIAYKPVITEKSIGLAQHGKFTFAVSRATTKLALSHVLEDTFKVHVEAVNIAKKPAKRKQRGAQSAITKAIVTVRKGEVIPGFELPAADEAAKDHDKHDHANEAVTGK